MTAPALHSQQKEALTSLGKWFSEEKTKDFIAVVSMPTGTGKTGIMCCLPYYLGGAGIPDTDFNKPILVIAPSLNILDQLEDNFYGEPFLKRADIGLIKEQESALAYTVRSVLKTNDVRALTNAVPYDIVISNAQKWRKKDTVPNYEELPNNLFSVIIVDEAHHLPAKQWQNIIDKFGKYAKVVFFTATPFRTDGQEITKDLALSKVGFAYRLSREEAIEARLIRDVEEQILNIDIDLDNMPTLKMQKLDNSSSSKINSDRMACAAQVLVKVRERLEEKNKLHPLPGGKKHAAIVVAYSIEEAKEVQKMCKKIGLEEVALVTSHNKKWTNEQTIEEIKQGKYQTVIIVRMLLEGFDYPPFSIAGIVTRIISPVKFAQFIGRVQRIVRVKNEDGEEIEDEKLKADIITHTYFEQEELIKKYRNPAIEIKEENKSLDDDDRDD